jgi:hypothetical protein
MYPHRIRLRGPWEYDALDVTKDQPSPSGRVTMPCPHWDGPPGRVRFLRRFGYPGRIDAHEHVWLVFDGLFVPVRVSVNGNDMGKYTGAVEVDVTQLLGARNELTVEVPNLTRGTSLWDEAALEVRCTAYLRNVQVKRVRGGIHATGEVIGTSEGPLELYLVADRSPAGYAKVDSGGGVRSFDLRAETTNRDGKPVGRVTIELIQGAVVWYTMDLPVPEEASLHPGA